jgi:predicted ArsR family transcriptional regulator
MSKKETILTLLQDKELTNKEIADKMGITVNEARVYVNRLKQENRVKSIGKRRRFKVYKAKEHIKELNLERVKEGYKQFNRLFENLVSNSEKMLKKSQISTFKEMISKHIDIGLIKQINEEIE